MTLLNLAFLLLGTLTALAIIITFVIVAYKTIKNDVNSQPVSYWSKVENND